MAVGLLKRNSETNYCEFSYDSWSTDSSKVPTMTTGGSDGLKDIRCCCQGSFAVGTDGTLKILSGNNTWVEY